MKWPNEEQHPTYLHQISMLCGLTANSSNEGHPWVGMNWALKKFKWKIPQSPPGVSPDHGWVWPPIPNGAGVTSSGEQRRAGGPSVPHLVCALSSFSMSVGCGLKTSSISLAPSSTGSMGTAALLVSSSSPESSDVFVRLVLGPASGLLCVDALLQCELSPLSSAPLPFSICCFLPRCSLTGQCKARGEMWSRTSRSPT